MPTRTISTVAHIGTIANQRAYAVNVTYEGESPSRVVFVGPDREVGPVTMIVGDMSTRVTDPSRFGAFGAGWVKRFFDDRD